MRICKLMPVAVHIGIDPGKQDAMLLPVALSTLAGDSSRYDREPETPKRE